MYFAEDFEVGQEVYDAFSAAGFPMERIARMYEKWHINLPLCNQFQLEELGVHAANILQSGICTYDNASDFFSARILKEGFWYYLHWYSPAINFHMTCCHIFIVT